MKPKLDKVYCKQLHCKWFNYYTFHNFMKCRTTQKEYYYCCNHCPNTCMWGTGILIPCKSLMTLEQVIVELI